MIDVFDHRTAADVDERFSWQARGLKSCRDDGNDGGRLESC